MKINIVKKNRKTIKFYGDIWYFLDCTIVDYTYSNMFSVK